jgi:hypothetical protein
MMVNLGTKYDDHLQLSEHLNNQKGKGMLKPLEPTKELCP